MIRVVSFGKIISSIIMLSVTKYFDFPPFPNLEYPVASLFKVWPKLRATFTRNHTVSKTINNWGGFSSIYTIKQLKSAQLELSLLWEQN